MGAYQKALRKERNIRLLGFVLLLLATTVQVLVVLNPPKQSLSASPNDILDGIETKDDILRAWDNNANGVRDIYSKFGITKDNISKISGQQPNSSVSSSQNYWSLGRLPMDSYGISSNRWGERSISVKGLSIYQRPLDAWDNHRPSSYSAFRGTNSYGTDFWILKDGGDLTFLDSYLPNAPNPAIEVHGKLLSSNAVVHRGDTLKFRIEYQNVEPNSLATTLKIRDIPGANLEYISLDNLTSKEGNALNISRKGALGYSPTSYASILTVRVKSSAPNLSSVCNIVSASSDQAPEVSASSCATVIAPGPVSGVTPNISQNYNYCLVTSTHAPNSPKDEVLRVSSYVSNSLKVTGYDFDIDDNGTIDYQDKSSLVTYEKQISNLSAGQHAISVYAKLSNSGGVQLKTAPCRTQINASEDARSSLSSSVANVSNVKATTLKSGDVIEFKLSTTNTTDIDYKNYNAYDYFGNVLQYAEITNRNQLSAQDIILDKTNTLRWTIPNLAAGTTDTRTIRVTLKRPTPLTNNPSGLSPDYNCRISNSYGTPVVVNINCPLIKSADRTTLLPFIDEKTAIIIGILTSLIAGYFFNRSRLLAKEVTIIRNDYTSAGGF